jgi:hypothetical protein
MRGAGIVVDDQGHRQTSGHVFEQAEHLIVGELLVGDRGQQHG